MHIRTLACALAVALVVFAPPAWSAKKITRTCYAEGCKIEFDGTIDAGDARIIEREIRRSLFVAYLEINSPGGNPFEALLIADVLNKYFISVVTSACYDGVCLKVIEGKRCVSACALLFLAAN